MVHNDCRVLPGVAEDSKDFRRRWRGGLESLSDEAPKSKISKWKRINPACLPVSKAIGKLNYIYIYIYIYRWPKVRGRTISKKQGLCVAIAHKRVQKIRENQTKRWGKLCCNLKIQYMLIPNLPTSSTAQGGGGSFKNRKPIGEIGCCESGMAERSHWWTERCLISLTLSLSFSGYLPTYPSIFYVSIYLSISLSIYRSIVVVVVVVVVGVVVVVVVAVAVAVVVEVRVVKLVKLVKLISVYFFDIFTSKKAQNPQFFTLLTSKCASRHNGVHFFDTFSTSEPPKVVRDRQFLTLLTWKCASRHNGVHFFDIATSKSGPRMVCFVHFDLEMCFAPQRRGIVRHLNFQKWSDADVFCTFWLGNVLRATTACTFSTSQLPKVVRRWGVLYILTWKCASRHNGVHFFDISTSKSGPNPWCFVHFDFQMCFAPQRRVLFHLSSGQLAPHPPL